MKYEFYLNENMTIELNDATIETFDEFVKLMDMKIYFGEGLEIIRNRIIEMIEKKEYIVRK